MNPFATWADVLLKSGKAMLESLEESAKKRQAARVAVIPTADAPQPKPARRKLAKPRSRAKAAKQPKGFHGQLRQYQLEGLGWIEFLREFGFGGIPLAIGRRGGNTRHVAGTDLRQPVAIHRAGVTHFFYCTRGAPELGVAGDVRDHARAAHQPGVRDRRL